MLKKVLMFFIIIATPLLVLLTSVQLMVQWDFFYHQEYINNQVVDNTNIQIEELMRVTDEIQKYLFDQRDDFNISGVVDGQVQQIYNEREIVHMEDVKVLFNKGILLRNGCALVIFILSIILYRKDKIALYKSFKWSSFVFIIALSVIGMLLLFDFSRYFVLFHEILFNNEYWVLDPNNSILINMVPLAFFTHMAMGIIGLSLLIMLILGFAGYKLNGKRKGDRYNA